MKKITVYTTANCPHCVELKQWLDDVYLDYIEINLSENKSAVKTIIKKVGYLGAPIIKIGSVYIVGKDMPAIRKELGFGQCK